jgi:glycosyltransferase involved in cell wall biosynthesis
VFEAASEVSARRPDSDFRFVCIGGDSHTSADGLFRYTGYVSEASRLATYYQAADVVLHAAHADNFPCVILEALACGTPVIATAVGGIPEEIDDGVTGWLVPKGDARAMARRVLEIAADPDLVRAMTAAASSRARREFAIDLQVSRYLDWFDELRAEHGGQKP